MCQRNRSYRFNTEKKNPKSYQISLETGGEKEEKQEALQPQSMMLLLPIREDNTTYNKKEG